MQHKVHHMCDHVVGILFPVLLTYMWYIFMKYTTYWWYKKECLPELTSDLSGWWLCGCLHHVCLIVCLSCGLLTTPPGHCNLLKPTNIQICIECTITEINVNQSMYKSIWSFLLTDEKQSQTCWGGWPTQIWTLFTRNVKNKFWLNFS